MWHSAPLVMSGSPRVRRSFGVGPTGLITWADSSATNRSNPSDAIPGLFGIHNVRLPVEDVVTARDWFVEVFGFECVLDYEVEEGIVGALLLPRFGRIDRTPPGTGTGRRSPGVRRAVTHRRQAHRDERLVELDRPA